MTPGWRGGGSELIIKASDYIKIGLIDVGWRSDVWFVVKLLSCVVNDTKRMNMGLDREIGKGCLVEVIAW